jgi:H+-transporting ATPase
MGTALAFVGLPGFMPLPWWQALSIFAYAMAACLVVNDFMKTFLIKRLVPSTA